MLSYMGSSTSHHKNSSGGDQRAVTWLISDNGYFGLIWTTSIHFRTSRHVAYGLVGKTKT